MQGSVLNINCDAAVVFANKLERMSKSALPVAVRQTLNSAAFDVKQKTMPAAAKQSFIQRQPNFFKANSKVVMAQGFDLHTMKSTVGFISLGGTNKAVEDLEQQEDGGKIGGRSFVPLPAARTSRSWKKKVKNDMRIANLSNKINDSHNAKGKSDKEKFIRSAVFAGNGGFVIGNKRTAGGSRILFQIRSIVRKKGNNVIKAVPVFAVKRNRQVNPAATHFMQRSSLKSAAGMNDNFVMNAKKQLSKIR